MTSYYLAFGTGNQVELTSGKCEAIIKSRWITQYRPTVANGVHSHMGVADREWVVTGGPVTYTEIGYLKTLTESSSATTFRADLTNNADVNVIILYVKYADAAFGGPGAVDSTHKFWVEVAMRESV